MVAFFALCQDRGHAAGILILSIILIPDIRVYLYAGNIRLVDAGLIDALSISAMITVLARPGRSRPARTADMFAILFVVMLIIFEARGTSVTNMARVGCQRFIDYLIPYWVVTRSLQSHRDMKVLIVYMIAAGCALSSLLILESVRGWTFFREIVARYGFDARWDMVKWRNGMLRASGPFLEPTSMAFGLVFIALAAWQFRSLFSSTLHRYAVVGFICVGIFTCQSRNAYLGLGLGLVAAEAFRRFGTPRGRLLLPIIGMMLVLAPISYFVAHGPGDGARSEEASTAAYRSRLLERGLEEARKHPVLGTDVGSVMGNLEDLRQGEHIIDFVNTYIYVLLLSGIVGVLVFVSMLTYGVYVPVKLVKLDSSRKLDPASAEMLSYIYAMSLVMLSMLFFTFFGGRVTVLIFTMIGLAGCAGKLLSSNAPSQRPLRPARTYDLPALN